MSSYLQAGKTQLLVVDNIGVVANIVTPGSSTFTVLNTGNEVVYICFGSAGVPAATPTVPQNSGDTSPGYALMPNWPTAITVAGYQSGNVVVKAVSAGGSDSVLITPVINIGEQSNVY